MASEKKPDLIREQPWIVESVRGCPICGNRQCEVLHEQKFTLPLGHPLPDHFDVVACPACGLVYADTTGTAQDYDRYYADHSKYADQGTSTGGGGNPRDQERLEATAAAIALHLPRKDARVVDIGCANGGMLGALKARSYSRLFGVDPSLGCVENTRSMFGIPAEQGWLLALPKDAAPADLLIVSHVLEHVLDLRASLEALVAVLAPGGMVYVEVPDAQRYVDCLVAPFQDFNTEHINHFGAASLKNLFAAAGFSPVTVGTKTLEAAPGVPYPALFGFFRRASAPQPAPSWELDQGFRASMDRYIVSSRAELCRIDDLLSGVLGEPVIVWGTGQLTMKLLAETRLGQARIAAFVDSNPVNHGKMLCGTCIVAPSQLASLPPHPIILGTLLHQEAITRQIRAIPALKNPVLVLG